MLRHLDVQRRLISGLRVVRPHAGAVANARDAVRVGEGARHLRREAAVAQGRVHGPAAWIPTQTRPGGDPAHAVQFYRSDAELGGWLAAYVADGLARGEHCLVLAGAEHRAALHQRLALAGLGGAAGRLLLAVDAEEVLQRFMRGGRPDPQLFPLVISELLQRGARPGAGVRAFGEMVGLLHARGNLDGALELEQLWRVLQRRLGFPLLCAYPLLDLPGGDEQRARVCREHNHLAAVGQP